MPKIALLHLTILRELNTWIIVLTIGLSATAFGQNLSLQQVKSELETAFQGTNEDPTRIILNYSREKFRKNNFVSQQEWLRSVRYAEMKAVNSEGRFYIRFCVEMAKKLRENGLFRDGYYFLYKARKRMEEHAPENPQTRFLFHEELGLSYYYFKRYDDAHAQLLMARSYCNKDQSRIGILNTIGLIKREQGAADSSRVYFEQALQLANRIGHKPWVAVLSGNLGEYYWKKGDLKQARTLCERDYRFSLETNQRGSAVNALSLLLEMDLRRKNTQAAAIKLQQLEQMLKAEYNISEYRVLYRAKTALLEATGDYRGALNSYRKVVLYADTIRKRTDAENVKKTEFQIDFERNQAEVSLLHEKKKRDELIIYGLIIITLSVIVLFVVFLNMFVKRRRREREIANLKQQQIRRELRDTEREMRAILSNLMEKNELVEQLTGEINQFQLTANDVSDEKVKLLDKLQSFTLLTDDDWLEFKKLFEKLNPSFFARLQAHSPDLTNAEIRLVTLIKLNLSNLEMSRALGISPDSVRKTSLRLRKKLNIELHEELVKFILSL